MKIFDTKDIRAIDKYTIKHEPVSSIDLMERASKGCAEWIIRNFAVESRIKVFTGPGNNGGDGYAIARILANKGYTVDIFHLDVSAKLSPDCQANRERIIREGKAGIYNLTNTTDFPLLKESDVLIDALFGSGLSRSLEGLAIDLVKYINNSECKIIAIDIPSGLFGEDNSNNKKDSVVRADFTLTFQFPKRAFFFAENERYTGKWQVISIGLHPDIISETNSDFHFIEKQDIRPLIKPRKRFSHKGNFGHALLIAGSYGMMGAAVLAARACLRTGAGLLTTHVPSSGYPSIQSAIPESIFSIDSNDRVFSACPDTGKYSAIGVGPGIGRDKKTVNALEHLIKNIRRPLILDADAINILAEHKKLLLSLPENTIITPHPGEFDRLTGDSGSGFERNRKQIQLSVKQRIIIVLKGAFTSITMSDGKCYYNSTGNPGMSTAGSGDVLSGMILSLLAQGYHPQSSALAAVYIHGLAGDLALASQSHESMIASDIIENIGEALKKITKNEKMD